MDVRAQVAEAGIVMDEEGSASDDDVSDAEGGGNGTVVANIGVPVQSGSVTWRAAVKRMLPLLKRFSPDLLLLSAGFDAHEHDPVGTLTLADEDYAWLTAELSRAADTTRIVSVLEGGYGVTPESK